MHKPTHIAFICTLYMFLLEKQKCHGGDGTLSQYNLMGVTDVIVRNLIDSGRGNRTEHNAVGANRFKLLTGDEYVVHPSSTEAPTLKIVVEDSNYVPSQAFYEDTAGLRLCPALPSTEVLFDNLPIQSDAPQDTTSQQRVYTFTISADHVKNNIFPLVHGRKRSPFAKLAVCAKLKSSFAVAFDAGDKARTRPLPLFTILFKNADVLGQVHDSRNVRVCEVRKHRHVHVDPLSGNAEFLYGPKGHGGPTETTVTKGLLKLYTPNHRTEKIEGAHSCRSTLYQVAFRCGDDPWDFSFSWLPKVEEQVDPEECMKWKEEKTCTVFSSDVPFINYTHTINLSQISSTQFKTNITDGTIYKIFNSQIHNKIWHYCINRLSGKMYVRDCMLDTDVPITYSFPYQTTTGGARVVSPYGVFPLGHVIAPMNQEDTSGPPSNGYTKDMNYGWKKMTDYEHPLATLMWARSKAEGLFKDAVLKHVCPFTLLTEMPVSALKTSHMHHTEMGISHGNKIKDVTMFVERNNDLLRAPESIKAYNSQKLTEADITRMRLDTAEHKCLMQGGANRAETYMVDGNLLLQYVDDSTVGNSAMVHNTWNRKRRKNVTPVQLPFPDESARFKTVNPSLSGLATDLEEAVCTGVSDQYEDAFRHTWKCVEGVPTLVSVTTNVVAVIPTPPRNKAAALKSSFSNIHSGSHFFERETEVNAIADAELKKVIKHMIDHNARLHNALENERIQKSLILGKIGLLEPSIFYELLFPGENIKVTKAGDYLSIHRCEEIHWRNVRVITSLRLDHPDMPLPVRYKHMGIRALPTHLTDLCYPTPMVQAKSAELGNFYALVVDNGRELSRNLNVLRQCNKGKGVIQFNVGDQIVSFSASTGDLVSVSERYTHPRSPAHKIYHVGNIDPLIESMESRGGIAAHSVQVGTGMKVDNLVLGTDADYKPKPEEMNDPMYQVSADSSIRHHVDEVSFSEALSPLAGGEFLSSTDTSSTKKVNLERLQREEREGIPVWHWPYIEQGEMLSKLEDTRDMRPFPTHRTFSKYRILEGGKGDRSDQDSDSSSTSKRSAFRERPQSSFSGVYPGGGPDKTTIDQRILPGGFNPFDKKGFIDSVHFHWSAFCSRYGDTLLTLTELLVIICVPVTLIVTIMNRTERRHCLSQLTYNDGGAASLAYMAGAVVGSQAAHTREPVFTSEMNTNRKTSLVSV